MISAGIDVGIRNVKAVLVNGSYLLSYAVVPAGKEAAGVVAESALRRTLEEAGIHSKQIGHLAVTGAGKGYIASIQEQLPEFLCLAKGIHRLLPSTGTLLDLGAHKALALRCREGTAVRTATNDKCAGGTSAYLEMAAKVLGIEVGEMAALSMKSKERLEVTSICAVFAESEIISLIHMKKKPEDILKGVFRGLAQRVYSLLVEVGLDQNIAIVGGVAKNSGVVKAIEELVGYPISVPSNPDIVGALGAALIAEKGEWMLR